MDRKINYAAINPNRTKELEYIDKQLENAGYGYIQRLAVLGNVQRESSGNPLAVSSNGLWHGIIQWDKDRYRIQSDNPKEELKRQTSLLLKELEKKGWGGATWKAQLAYAKSFKDSSDLNEAVDIFTRRFVRPGDIEGEIKKRLSFAQSGFVDQEEQDYDLETAKKVLPKNLIKAWQRNPEKNHLPSGYTDDKGNWRSLKSVYHPSWKEEMEWQAKPENLDEMLKYGYQENYVSRFPVYKPFMKYQQGGLIYKGFYPEEPKYKHEELNYHDFDVFNSRFPVESVMVYTPKQKETSTKVEETPVVEETTFAPLIQKGTIEYKSKDIDLGNMKELVELMRDEGISFRITSGSRPGSKTSNGSMSHHSSGNALDITPVQGQSWDDLISQMRRSKRFISYMREHKLGILDERSKKMQAKTGATGAHFHIGPDIAALSNFNLMFR